MVALCSRGKFQVDLLCGTKKKKKKGLIYFISIGPNFLIDILQLTAGASIMGREREKQKNVKKKVKVKPKKNKQTNKKTEKKKTKTKHTTNLNETCLFR